MDEPERKCRGPLLWLAGRSRRFWIVVALLPVLPVLYVASFGQALQLEHSGDLPDGTLVTFYWPLIDMLEGDVAPVWLRSALNKYYGFAIQSIGPDLGKSEVYWTTTRDWTISYGTWNFGLLEIKRYGSHGEDMRCPSTEIHIGPLMTTVEQPAAMVAWYSGIAIVSAVVLLAVAVSLYRRKHPTDFKHG